MTIQEFDLQLSEFTARRVLLQSELEETLKREEELMSQAEEELVIGVSGDTAPELRECQIR